MKYQITAYRTSGIVAYNVVVNTEEQIMQEIRDALRDGYLPLITPAQGE